jgi:cytochrome b involved in lipid metabolism
MMPNHFTSYIQEKLKNYQKTFYYLQWIFSVSYFSFDSILLLLLLLLIDALNNLQNRLLNMKVVQLPKRKQFTLKDVSAHCAENDCWMVVRDLVYDVTDFMREVDFLLIYFSNFKFVRLFSIRVARI